MVEIKAAVEQLPELEQKNLLEHLSQKLGVRGATNLRGIWLQELDRLRARNATPAGQATPLQQILDDIR